MIKILISILVNSPGYVCDPLDIAQAFIQSGEVALSDQVIGTPPEFLHFDSEIWRGQLRLPGKEEAVGELAFPPSNHSTFAFGPESDQHQKVKTIIAPVRMSSPYGFLIRMPLYGSRHAPLRWWMKLPGIAKKGRYVQMRGNVCTFVRRRRRVSTDFRLIERSDYILLSVVISHVEDFLFVGSK